MAHKAQQSEEQSLQREEVLRPEAMAEAFPSVRLKVVYLGSHPRKTERLKGSIEMDTVPDEENPGKVTHINRKMSSAGYTTYDFAKVDSRGREKPTTGKRADPYWTEDGKRFQWVEHLGHAMAFYRMVDADGQAVYQIRGTPEAMMVLKRYREALKGRKDSGIGPHERLADSGESVLKDMSDVI